MWTELAAERSDLRRHSHRTTGLYPDLLVRSKPERHHKALGRFVSRDHDGAGPPFSKSS
jgi:hypothetical protein